MQVDPPDGDVAPAGVAGVAEHGAPPHRVALPQAAPDALEVRGDVRVPAVASADGDEDPVVGVGAGAPDVGHRAAGEGRVDVVVPV